MTLMSHDVLQKMTSVFLKQGDYNVVIVDWGSGSLGLYGQASANTRVVGAMIAQLITFLQVHEAFTRMGNFLTLLSHAFHENFASERKRKN